MLSLKSYSLLTITSTLIAIWYAFETRVQFYPAMMYLSSSKFAIMVIGNFVLCIMVLIGDILRRIFLGTLAEDEMQSIYDHARFALTETCLALTIFREELSVKVLALFTSLLLVKMFHWMAHLRVDQISRVENAQRWKHVQLISLLAYLFINDVILIAITSYLLLLSETPSVLFLFAFEYTILLVSVISEIGRMSIYYIDTNFYNPSVHPHQHPWLNKSLYIFALDLICDSIRLILYLLFFVVVCLYYGLPLHLIREVYMTFHTLREKCIKFYQYRQATKNMNQRFPEASAAELASTHDPTCIICREDMQAARKLPCNHMFHFWCLRRWLETDMRCPTCRAPISLTGPIPPAHVHAPAAAVPAPHAMAAPVPAAPQQPAPRVAPVAASPLAQPHRTRVNELILPNFNPAINNARDIDPSNSSGSSSISNDSSSTFPPQIMECLSSSLLAGVPFPFSSSSSISSSVPSIPSLELLPFQQLEFSVQQAAILYQRIEETKKTLSQLQLSYEGHLANQHQLLQLIGKLSTPPSS